MFADFQAATASPGALDALLLPVLPQERQPDVHPPPVVPTAAAAGPMHAVRSPRLAGPVLLVSSHPLCPTASIKTALSPCLPFNPAIIPSSLLFPPPFLKPSQASSLSFSLAPLANRMRHAASFSVNPGCFPSFCRQPPGSSAPKEITDSAPSAADSSSYSTKQWEAGPHGNKGPGEEGCKGQERVGRQRSEGGEAGLVPLSLPLRAEAGQFSSPKRITSHPRHEPLTAFSAQTLLLFLLGASRGLPAAPAYMVRPSASCPCHIPQSAPLPTFYPSRGQGDPAKRTASNSCLPRALDYQEQKKLDIPQLLANAGLIRFESFRRLPSDRNRVAICLCIAAVTGYA